MKQYILGVNVKSFRLLPCPKKAHFNFLDPPLMKMKTAPDFSETFMFHTNFTFVSHFLELTILAAFEVKNFQVSTFPPAVLHWVHQFWKFFAPTSRADPPLYVGVRLIFTARRLVGPQVMQKHSVGAQGQIHFSTNLF